MAGPLSHVRVLDLSRIMAGPWAGQILADLGADVVKVERPGAGDDTRGWGPPFLKDRSGAETREAGYYLSVNRGKRSITLELDKPEGQRVVRALAERSDIVLENFKVGTLARFGLGYEQLKAVNPKLIYCSITGFGQSGPRRDAAAYDFMIQAMCGLMSVTGEPDDKPGGCPREGRRSDRRHHVGHVRGDLGAGGAGAAQRDRPRRLHRHRHARRRRGVSRQPGDELSGLRQGAAAHRQRAIPTSSRRTCSPRATATWCWWSATTGSSPSAARCSGGPNGPRDERFAKNAGRVRNCALLDPSIAEILRQRDTADWIARLEAAGVPCGPINTVPQVFEEEQVRHRGMLVDIAHPLAGTVPQVVSPMRFAEAPLAFDRAPPLLGEHTAEILRELGIEDARQGAA